LSPLAPTKLSNFAAELDPRRKRGIESKVDRVCAEFVFHPLESEHVDSRKDRRDDRLAPGRVGVGRQLRARSQVVDDFGWA
jgi:hypothetical protein